jgi:large subunit ribosomal protein L13
MNQLIIDGTDCVLGRLSTYIAKQALLGKSLAIVNCNNVRIIGSKKTIVSEYMKKRLKGGDSLNGPFFPKSPERIVKRTIRGMLDYTKGRGESAFNRVMCYNDVPKEFEQKEKLNLSSEIKAKSMTLKELSKVI